jgi:RNA polymerase sigma factor (sigma-70 family)
MTGIDTAELVRRATTGEELAWCELVARYSPLLRHTARPYGLGDAEAADAVAATWLRLVEHISSLRDGTRVASWLVTTLRRECLARLNAHRREYPVDSFPGRDEPAAEVDMDRQLVDEEHRRLIRRALAQLSGRERRLAIMLLADPSPSYRQISASLSIPVGSIGPTRSRLLRKMRLILAVDESELALAG